MFNFCIPLQSLYFFYIEEAANMTKKRRRVEVKGEKRHVVGSSEEQENLLPLAWKTAASLGALRSDYELRRTYVALSLCSI